MELLSFQDGCSLKEKADMEPMETEAEDKYLKREPSEKAVTELHTAFDILDRNSDGHVYVDDIHDMMTALGHEIEKDNVKDFVKSAGSGGHSIREHEFVSWMEKLDHKHNNDEVVLKGAFETFDKDKDGFISKVELKEGLILIGENVSDRTLDLMMQEADKDNDGLISFEDFAHIMN